MKTRLPGKAAAFCGGLFTGAIKIKAYTLGKGVYVSQELCLL